MPKHVFFALPAYSGTVHVGTCRSLIAATLALVRRGDLFTLADELGSAMIGKSRDVLLAQFLGSGASHCLFIDHDVVFAPQAALRLVDAGVDFVAGIYPHRSEPRTFPVAYLDEPELRADPATGLLAVAGVPAGFLCLTRECVLRLWSLYADRQFDDDKAPGGYAVNLFGSIQDERAYLSEDYSLCRRWREIGGDVWIDPELSFGHIGNKMFEGCLGDHLRMINNLARQPRSASVA